MFANAKDIQSGFIRQTSRVYDFLYALLGADFLTVDGVF